MYLPKVRKYSDTGVTLLRFVKFCKIKNVYNCEIIEATIPITDNQLFKQYYLKIIIEQSDPSILKVDKLKEIDIEKYKQVDDINVVINKQPIKKQKKCNIKPEKQEDYDKIIRDTDKNSTNEQSSNSRKTKCFFFIECTF